MCWALLLLAVLSPVPGRATETEDAQPRTPTKEERARYTWLSPQARVRRLASSLPPPEGYKRIQVTKDSFGAWLRGLPLRPEGTPVLSHQGTTILAAGDSRLAAVVELDVGTANLQQCADSVIRLHAEWLWAGKQPDRLAYRFTSGDLAAWSRYAAGDRARVAGSKVTWVRSAAPDASRASFRAWLDLVFTYAGTHSLSSLKARPSREDVRPGDFFVLGGSPGHVVLVLDVAANAAGKKVALLGQGFMPAQDFHVLAAEGETGVWFPLEEGEDVVTPFWKPFPWSSLRRF